MVFDVSLIVVERANLWKMSGDSSFGKFLICGLNQKKKI